MRICRHCSHSKVPGGARLAKQAASRAGFDGTLHIICYGRDKPTKADVGNKEQLDGSFFPPHGIRLYNFGPHAQGFKWALPEEHQFKVFLHELGHFIRRIKGLPDGEGLKGTILTSAERYCDRYAEREFRELWKSK